MNRTLHPLASSESHHYLTRVLQLSITQMENEGQPDMQMWRRHTNHGTPNPNLKSFSRGKALLLSMSLKATKWMTNLDVDLPCCHTKEGEGITFCPSLSHTGVNSESQWSHFRLTMDTSEGSVLMQAGGNGYAEDPSKDNMELLWKR